MNELQQLRDEITQLNTALTIKNGTIAQLKARNAQLEDRNAALAVQVEARQVPEGWKVDRRELDGAVCFTIGTPRKNGVRTNTGVFESDHDPALLLLWHLLAAPQAEQSALDGLIASVGGGSKACGHDFECGCALDKARRLLESE